MTTTTVAMQARAALPHGASRVVVVSPDRAFGTALSSVLESTGFAVRSFASAGEALSADVSRGVEFVVFDVDGAASDRGSSVGALRRVDPRVKVVVTSSDPAVANDPSTFEQLGVDVLVHAGRHAEAIVEVLRSLRRPTPPRLERAAAGGRGKGAVARLTLTRVKARPNPAT